MEHTVFLAALIRNVLYHTIRMRCPIAAKPTCLPTCRGGVLDVGMHSAAFVYSYVRGHMCVRERAVGMRNRFTIACTDDVCVRIHLGSSVF